MHDKQIETLPIQQQDKLKQLQEDVKHTSKGLNPRQKHYCELMAMQDKSGAECARLAGYAKKNAEVRSSTLLRSINIRSLIEKYQNLQTYEHGRGVPWMRSQLEELLTLAKEKKDISGGNGVIRTIAELDGAIMSKGKGGSSAMISISINTGLGSDIKAIKGEIID